MYEIATTTTSAQIHPKTPINPLHLPWAVTRLLDRRAVREKLDSEGLRKRRPQATELERFLVDRAGEARDLFVLRGVKTRRTTVFQLMSRSIAADAPARERILRLTTDPKPPANDDQAPPQTDVRVSA